MQLEKEESVAIHHVKSYDTILLGQKSNNVHEYLLTVGPITSPPNYIKSEREVSAFNLCTNFHLISHLQVL